ncbi:hypothetical protein LTR62_002655 [Meristemomyces frigidus]|uniref:DUF1754-domain-containing protein n=1 Tax=Meristemomyces frigidus TaxID=1508187 RepID=A0AAN7YHA1_9PEZI|nr:hypothetical protein LTR62_002655 [Meristemomyces frigidus]
MPSSDYGNAVGGGLKLKGAKDAGVKKKKKSKTPKPSDATTSMAIVKKPEAGDAQNGLADEDVDVAEEGAEKARDADVKQYGKTEAQRRFDEQRRKRLDERLQREGIKTHKERVEELNKYLSGLSEHHDMPKIGPG